MYATPPKWMIKCLEAVCPESLLDEVEGDLFEYYACLQKKKSEVHANRKAFFFILRSAPRLLFKKKIHQSTTIDMLRNYIIITLRNIKRQLGYSLVNILGLAVGLACCILIGLYVEEELSYDKFHKDSENIYRVNLTFDSPQGTRKTYTTPSALLPTLQREFNNVTDGFRMLDVGSFSPVIVQKGANKYKEDRFFYADSTFFDVFSFKVISGNPEKSLVDPKSLVLTSYTAQKYFGDEDPMNQTLRVDGTDYTVTAIVEDVPANSHFQFDFLSSFSTLSASKKEIWGSANYATYIKLSPGSNPENIETGIRQKVAETLGESLGDMQLIFDLVPLTDIHLRSEIPNEMQPQNSITYIYMISMIGLLILIIACINYMNLATARSVERAREVGMRKVLGAIRKQVFYQFMGESAVITALAILAALVIVSLTLSPFNALTGKALTIADLANLPVIVGLFLTFLLVSFIAGAYPALSLSSFAPSGILKGNFKRSKTGNTMRQVLVVFQFSISIFLIIGTMVVIKQLDYAKTKKLGYNKDNVIVLPTDKNVNENFQTIKSELERREDVLGVSIASETPVNVSGGYSLDVPGIIENAISVNAVTVDKQFIENMDIQLRSGRHFNDTDLKLVSKENWEAREYAFIVNQQVLAALLIDEERILGQPVNLNGREGEIVGVIEDFHSTSIHRKITPMVFFIEPAQYNKLFIRINTDNMQKSLLAIEDKWNAIVPDRPFVFEFMDDEYDAMYRSEERLSNVFGIFAGLAIIIACLGLFGLVSFAVEQRNKEIGVRKVLGASVAGLFFLISKDFSKLVLIAFIVAAPLAYWLMQEWLADFEYRTTIGVFPIVFAVVLALVIAMLTVSCQSIKAAMTNPVETLRSE
ncbi:FtsX-like permease family protein [Fulvivirga sp. RKSG066]|uniref:ABC transporter permease n=1 Tax=Fulvivirga aurantia TaxID=2529383 RepID=UPI0012BD765E|nr:ABC transporter permease [Fulvivirga aurantia]MTI22529.1 FtsX-like permease family protein [Fulvivirga aurantia]